MTPALRACVLLATALVLTPALAADVTVLQAARIHTMDASKPTVEAMAYDADGKILALGSAADLRKQFPDASVLARPEATVVPGLIDSHGHLPNLGIALMRADLTDTRSKAEIIERLKAFEKTLQPGDWLLGRGWDQNDWDEKVFPTAADLDAAFPDRPVWIERIDGHASWANSAAIKRSAKPLTGDWQPDGGKILRDDQGQPTGIFVDAAAWLIEQQVPALDDAGTERMLAAAAKYAVERGLTGVHDAGVNLQSLQAFQRLADRKALPLRVSAMADGDGKALAWVCEHGPYQHPSGRLQMRMVKLFADGALGSRGAALLEDYADEKGNRGLLLTDATTLDRLVRKAHGCGLQVATHAIGDRGNQIVLDTYEKVLGDKVSSDHRWRIEHAQVIAPADLPRLGKLGVIAAMQPTHATSDAPWAETRVGPERIVGAYAWRQLLDSGARLALGSDFPVESVDPRLGLHAAVTRTDVEGRPPGGWRMQEALTREEALRGFTLDAAFAGFADTQVGSLAVGKRADFVVLGGDPLAEGSDLRTIPVLATHVDGEAVFTAE